MPRPGLLLRAVAAVAILAVLTPLPAYAAGGTRATYDDLGRPAVHHAASVPGAGRDELSRSSVRDSDATPLSMTIDQLSPGTIPRHGPLRISGTVTNDDTQTWSDIHVYPFISGEPMTTSAELAEASTADPALPVGSRITSVFDDIGNLAPGQTVAYSVSIPRNELVYNDPDTGESHPITEPGVYWFGVHALGADAEGRDLNADGRARTFLPLLPQKKDAVPARVALLLPIRRLVRLAPDGSVADVAGWTADLTDGQLARIVHFGSGDLDVTWLVDPAVLDAVRRLAAGNPPRDLTPATTTSTPTPTPGATPTGATVTTAPAPTPSTSGTPEDPQTAAARQAATTWLAAFKAATTNREVLSLPYGDPDLSALAADLPSAYRTARDQAEAVFKDLGITATPVAAPLSGYLSPQALTMIGARTTALIGSQAVGGRSAAQVDVDGTVLDVLASKPAEGGPLPGDPLAPVTLRQRLLAEAALRYDRPNQPLAVVFPATWLAPSNAAAFERAFSAYWVDVQGFSSVETDVTPRPITPAELSYPSSEATSQVSPQTLQQVRHLIAAGTTLENVLPEHTTVAAQVAAQALTSTSYSARGGDDGAAMMARQNIDALLSQVHIDPPTAVTLSSASGRFSVTVANDMPQPVSVGLRAISDDRITIDGPDSLEIAAGDTASVLLTADAHSNGVHQIRLELVDSQGHVFGQPVHFPVRASQVSGTIWLFVGVGVGLLFLAIAVRLVRRIRPSHRATHAEVS